VSYNAGADLGRCIDSLLNQGLSIEVIVVDNGSSDGSVDRARIDNPEIRVLSDGINDGFAGGANRGAAVAKTDKLLFLNPDVVLEPGSLNELVDALGGTSDVIGPVVVDSESGTAEYGLAIDWIADPVGLASPRPPLYLSGCALMTTCETFAELGGFDAAFFMFCEDLDFSWRALLHGHDVRVVSTARVSHRGGGSASGGYINNGRIEVTAFRIALRERNTLAAVIRSGPLLWVSLIVPLRLARIGAIAVVAILNGRYDLSLSLAEGVAWNLRRIPELLRQRRNMPTSPTLRRRVRRERVRRELNSIKVLIKHGLPRFVDRKVARDPDRMPIPPTPPE